jgi:hypothetical protein
MTNYTLLAGTGVFSVTTQSSELVVSPSRNTELSTIFQNLVMPVSVRWVDSKTGMLTPEWEAFLRRFNEAWNTLQQAISRPH